MTTDQAFVERFNHTLAKRLFGHQCAVEMLPPSDQRPTAWVKTLPDFVDGPNSVVTDLTGFLRTKKSSPPKFKWLSVPPGKLGGRTEKEIDPNWSLKVYTRERSAIKPNEPVIYYLNFSDGK